MLSRRWSGTKLNVRLFTELSSGTFSTLSPSTYLKSFMALMRSLSQYLPGSDQLAA